MDKLLILMHKSFFIRNYGKLLFFPVFLLIYIIELEGYRIIYNQVCIDLFMRFMEYQQARYVTCIFNGLGLILLIWAFLGLLASNFQKNTIVFLILYIPFLYLCFFLLFSFFIDLDDMGRGFELPTDEGLIGLLILPVILVVFFALGFFFDYKRGGRAE